MADQGVGERQNDPHALNLLAAQRCLYSRAKRYAVGETLVTVALAAVSPLVIWLAPDSSQWLAAIAGGWLLAARLLFQPQRRVYVEQAARMQEAFDTHVFDLGWNDALGSVPAREDVATWAGRYKANPAAPLTDWYDPTDGSLAAQAVASQRMSVVWSRRLHRRFSRFLAWATGLWSASMLAIALAAQLSLSEALVALVLPSLPAVLAGVDRALGHGEASRKAEAIERNVGKALTAKVDGGVARSLQDEVFHFRGEAPLVPDWFYRFHRREDQSAMEYGADEFRSDK